ILEIRSLLERAQLFAAYKEAFASAQQGRPTLIYPTGWGFEGDAAVTIADFGTRYGIPDETNAFADENKVAIDTKVWIPGSLMSFRDARALLQCLFYLNALPGGEAHPEGGMKARAARAVLSAPPPGMPPAETARLDALKNAAPRVVVTEARPAKGTPNLT